MTTRNFITLTTLFLGCGASVEPQAVVAAVDSATADDMSAGDQDTLDSGATILEVSSEADGWHGLPDAERRNPGTPPDVSADGGSADSGRTEDSEQLDDVTIETPDSVLAAEDSTDVATDWAEDAEPPDADDSIEITGSDVASTDATEPYDCSSEAQMAFYLKRIEPLVSGAKPSSCNQCHLSGMDLSMYVQGTPCKTMACMAQKGLVDLEDPPSSAVLAQILQAEPESGLITEAVISEEHDGFLEWIEYSKHCHADVCGAIDAPCSSGTGSEITPSTVPTPLGSCSEDAILASFEANVFEWRLRCHGCHSNCDPDWNAPCWLQEEFDESSAEAKTQAALVTMYNLIGLGAVNAMNPHESSMLLKPAKNTLGGIYHGGGDKFADAADPAYQDFKHWLELYSACFQGQELAHPVVTIISPADKKKVYEGESMLFMASAQDAQDGALTAITWSSDKLEEPFGSGVGPFAASLPVGKHVITATATDSDGNEGVRLIKVWVKAPLPTP